jgi:uncharacterized protein involved in exopolysaccharide biosynthesis
MFTTLNSLTDWLPVLLRRPFKWAAGAGLLAAILAISTPNEYRSEALILPTEGKNSGGLGSLGTLATAAAALGVASPGGPGNDSVYQDILRSRWLGDGLLNTTYTYPMPTWRFGAERSLTGTLHDYLSRRRLVPFGDMSHDRALDELATIFTSRRDIKTGVLTLGAETRSPELSRLIVKRATALLEEFVKQRAQTRGGHKAVFVDARLQDAHTTYALAEQKLQAFLNSNRNYQQNPDPAIHLKGDRLTAEVLLRRQVVSALTLSREQALMDEKDDMPILNVLDEANLPDQKSRPSRSAWVVAASCFAFVLVWGYERRKEILARFFVKET